MSRANKGEERKRQIMRIERERNFHICYLFKEFLIVFQLYIMKLPLTWKVR